MAQKSVFWAIAFVAAGIAPAFGGSKAAEEVLGELPDGYVARDALPDSLALVPPAPVPGSVRQNLDDANAAAALTLEGTARFDLARRDADLHFPQATDAFACALGVRITEQQTPRLQQLMIRSLVDAGLSTYGAKNNYQRARPFTINGAPICTPEDEEVLRSDGSYPSGHTAIGWAWALILAEIAPDRATAILARGLAFGDSRVVCNVHWRNDVVMGRMMGAAAVAMMHSNPEFVADIEAAKLELATAKAMAGPACDAESAALAIRP